MSAMSVLTSGLNIQMLKQIRKEVNLNNSSHSKLCLFYHEYSVLVSHTYLDLEAQKK